MKDYSATAASEGGTPFPQRGVTSGDGMFHRASKYPFSAVRDGLTNTIMVIEAAHYRPETKVETCFNPWFWTHYLDYGFVIPNNSSNNGGPYIINARTTANDGIRTAYSAHTGGVNISLGDASVRFLAQTVDHTDVYTPLMMRNSGKSVSVP